MTSTFAPTPAGNAVAAAHAIREGVLSEVRKAVVGQDAVSRLGCDRTLDAGHGIDDEDLAPDGPPKQAPQMRVYALHGA